MYTDSQALLKIATTASKMGMVRHLEIRYHLVRCIVLSSNIELTYCITEEMLADLFIYKNCGHETRQKVGHPLL
jgi:hypothetical protein